MATLPTLKPIVPKPDVKAALLQRILDRTKENKFCWEKKVNAYEGQSKDGSILATISIKPPIFGQGGWSRLLVTRNREELLNIENTLSLLTLSGATHGSPQQLVTELVEFLEEQRLQGVRDAIAVLDRL